MIITNLGKTIPIGREELSIYDRISEWTEFDSAIARENLKQYELTYKLSYWSCTTDYYNEVYIFKLETGNIDAFHV